MMNTRGRGDASGISTDRQAISSRNDTQSKSGRHSNFIDDVDHYIDSKKNGGYSHGNRSNRTQNGGDVSNRHGNKSYGKYGKQNASDGNRSYRNQNGGGVSNRHGNKGQGHQSNHGDTSARDPYEMSPGQRDLVSRIYGEHSIFMIYKDDEK